MINYYAGSAMESINFDKEGAKNLIERREAALAQIGCTDLRFGQWIDDFDMSFLESIFSLSDDDFQESFSEMNLTAGEREFLRSAITLHAGFCPHCQLKTKFDQELDRILGFSETEINNCAVGQA